MSFAVGERALFSGNGPGEITGITEAGYPQVGGVACAWIVTSYGRVWDPRGVLATEGNRRDTVKLAVDMMEIGLTGTAHNLLKTALVGWKAEN